MAAEQKAKSTYNYILNLTDDPDVITPIKFLREREIVHFQRFGECLRTVQEYLDSDHFFMMPGVDCGNKKEDCGCKKNKKEDCGCKKNKKEDCGCKKNKKEDCGCKKKVLGSISPDCNK